MAAHPPPSSTTTEVWRNSAPKYVRKLLKNEVAQADGKLVLALQTVLSGHCYYLEGFNCAKNDRSLFDALVKELQLEAEGGAEESLEEGLVQWSKHLKHENPTFSETFQSIVESLSSYFAVDVYATRLNFYRDGSDWKPYHKDSHAYSSTGVKEDFTIGASFGASRSLSFLHEQSSTSFSFPQANGDVFAFDSDVNDEFLHGVPRGTGGAASGARISIIAWGRRRELNVRNSGCGGGKTTFTMRREEGKGGEALGNGGAGSADLQEGTNGVGKAIDPVHREAMRAEAARVRSEIGEGNYRSLRSLSRKMQRGEEDMEGYATKALSLVNGRVEYITRLLRFLPSEEKKDQVRLALDRLPMPDDE